MADAIAIASTETGGSTCRATPDWIDPSDAPGVGTPVRGGATFREAHLALEMAADSGRLLAMTWWRSIPCSTNGTGRPNSRSI